LNYRVIVYSLLAAISVFGCKNQVKNESTVKDETDNTAGFTCPVELSFQFGRYSSDLSPQSYDSVKAMTDLSNTSQIFIKRGGIRVCRYGSDSIRGILRLFNYNRKRIYYEAGFSVRDNVSFFHIITESDMTAGKITLQNAKFEHFEYFVDEDGCAFGQTTCEPFPASFGDGEFSELKIDLGGSQTPIPAETASADPIVDNPPDQPPPTQPDPRAEWRTFQCPAKFQLKFGTYNRLQMPANSQVVQFFSSFGGKQVTLERKKGIRVCHYGLQDQPKVSATLKNYRDKVLTVEMKNNREDNGNLRLVINPDHWKPNGSFAKTPLKVNHYKMYFDEDGCAFGQTPCVDVPVDIGNSNYSEVTISW